MIWHQKPVQQALSQIVLYACMFYLQKQQNIHAKHLSSKNVIYAFIYYVSVNNNSICTQKQGVKKNQQSIDNTCLLIKYKTCWISYTSWYEHKCIQGTMLSKNVSFDIPIKIIIMIISII